MPKITKRSVDALRPDPSGKDVFFWDSGDGAIKGFGVRMKPSGAASYLIQYRNKEGRTQRLVLGQASVITPEQARSLATERLSQVARGQDPSADRHASRDSLTVAELCDLYLQDSQGQIKASTWDANQSRIRCHVLPLLGRRAVNGLSLSDLERFQLDIANGKTAVPRPENGRGGVRNGGRGVAARTLGMFSTILEYARKREIISKNPARDVKKFEGKKNRRFLTRDDLTQFGAALGELGRENHLAVAAIKALLLTGCRRNEILALPTNWLDLQANTIRFGDTKSGAQLRPIGSAAVEVFRSLPPSNSRWVFPSEKGSKHFVGLPKVLKRVCTAAGLENVSLHVLRHTFASAAAELGFSELTIAGLLGHSVPGVTARYAHVADSALIAAANRVSEYLSASLEGLQKGEVISLALHTHAPPVLTEVALKK